MVTHHEPLASSGIMTSYAPQTLCSIVDWCSTTNGTVELIQVFFFADMIRCQNRPDFDGLDYGYFFLPDVHNNNSYSFLFSLCLIFKSLLIS